MDNIIKLFSKIKKSKIEFDSQSDTIHCVSTSNYCEFLEIIGELCENKKEKMSKIYEDYPIICDYYKSKQNQEADAIESCKNIKEVFGDGNFSHYHIGRLMLENNNKCYQKILCELNNKSEMRILTKWIKLYQYHKDDNVDYNISFLRIGECGNIQIQKFSLSYEKGEFIIQFSLVSFKTSTEYKDSTVIPIKLA